MDECPSNTLTSFSVIPDIDIFVANVWRNVWTVYGTPTERISSFRFVVSHHGTFCNHVKSPERR